MTAPSDDSRARKKWWLRLTLGVLVLLVLIPRGDIGQLQKALSGVEWYVPLVSVLLYWLTQCLSVIKWRLLLRARGAEFSFAECARLYLTGMFWNLWMPTTIGGDAMRALQAAPKCGGVTIAASSILVERLTGLLALLFIGTLGVALWGTQDSALGPQLLPRLLGVFFCAAVGFLLLRHFAYRFEHSAPPRLTKYAQKWASLHHEIDFYAHRERRSFLINALLLSLVFQSAQVALNLYLASAVGLPTPTTVFLWLVPLLSLISMVPLGIGGLGVREATAVAVLGSSVTQSTVIAWSLLWQTTVWLASSLGVLATFSKRRARLT